MVTKWVQHPINWHPFHHLSVGLYYHMAILKFDLENRRASSWVRPKFMVKYLTSLYQLTSLLSRVKGRSYSRDMVILKFDLEKVMGEIKI